MSGCMPSLYSAHCETCLRPDRKGVPDSGYPSVIALDDRVSYESVATIIERGKGRMTGFPQLDDNEKERLIAFLFDD